MDLFQVTVLILNQLMLRYKSFPVMFADVYCIHHTLASSTPKINM